MLDPPADPFGRSWTGRRLAERMRRRPDERTIAWSRAWTSLDGRWHWVLAARHRDFVVLTDRCLILFSCGFFTRRPRRNVFDEPLRGLVVDGIGSAPRRHLRVRGPRGRPLRLDLGGSERSRVLAAALVERVAVSAAPDTGAHDAPSAPSAPGAPTAARPPGEEERPCPS